MFHRLRRLVHHSALVLSFGSGLLLIIAISGCGSDSGPSADNAQYQAADDTAGNGGAGAGSSSTGQNSGAIVVPPNKPPVLSSDSLNSGVGALTSFKVPDGTPEEILAFVQQLEAIEITGQSEKEAMAQFVKIRKACIEGANKILAQASSDEIRMTAVHTKVQALRMLDQSGDEAAEQQLVQFATELGSDKNPEIARLGRLLSLSFDIDRFATDRDVSFQSIKESVAQLLADKDSQPHVAQLGENAASVLYEAGKTAEARELFVMLSSGIRDNPDLTQFADRLSMQARLIDIDFAAKIQAAMENKPNAATELVTAIKQLGNQGPVFEVAAQAASNLEQVGKLNVSAELYTLINQMAASHSDKEMAENARQAAERGLRRTNIVGKPFEVTGVTTDGKPLDWSQYRGKVVLVDFWATWCGPCLAELPNIERNYNAFRAKGFEVIGVNMDEDPAAVTNFLSQRRLPWPTIVSADPDAKGFNNPLAVRCGIEAIPFLVLVDAQGVAVGLHVRGPELEQRLTAMLGASELSSKATTRPNQPANQTASPASNPLR